MKNTYIASALVVILAGCGSDDVDNAVVDAFGKDFETTSEKQVYAQYVADSTAAIVDAIFQKGCTTSGECSLNGYSYTIGSRDYILQSTTNVTVSKSGDVLTISAQKTNPDEQIFLKDTNTNTDKISVNLLDGTYSIRISGSSSPYDVTLHALYTDSQTDYGEQGLTFKVQSSSNFSFDSSTHILSSGTATTTYKRSAKYTWGLLNMSGIAALN